jgi:hypothetical protein
MQLFPLKHHRKAQEREVDFVHHSKDGIVTLWGPVENLMARNRGQTV